MEITIFISSNHKALVRVANVQFINAFDFNTTREDIKQKKSSWCTVAPLC